MIDGPGDVLAVIVLGLLVGFVFHALYGDHK